MNIGLIGYGKMGKSVETLALKRGHNIVSILDINNIDNLNTDLAKKIDVAIEFSTPESANSNIVKCLELGISVVSGTTGWSYNPDELDKLAKQNNAAIFIASNFSVGVNLFMEVNKKLAGLMETFNTYKVNMEETHHIHKLDKPSGTAISLANDIIKENSRYVNWKLKPENDIHNIQIESFREGETIGNHKIIWNSEIDTISIEHNAKNRSGFTSGALLAAEYINGKTGFYKMKDLLNL